MTRIASSLSVILSVVLTFFGGRAISAQDKYTLQVPDGLAFSEFIDVMLGTWHRRCTRKRIRVGFATAVKFLSGIQSDPSCRCH